MMTHFLSIFTHSLWGSLVYFLLQQYHKQTHLKILLKNDKVKNADLREKDLKEKKIIIGFQATKVAKRLQGKKNIH